MNKLGAYNIDENILNTIKSLAKGAFIITFLKISIPAKVIEAEIIDNNEKKLSQYWPRLSTETHGWIDWNWNLVNIYRFCCAFSFPYELFKLLITISNISPLHVIDVNSSSLISIKII